MSRQWGGVAELSEPEQRFNRRWRGLIDQAGGQSRVVNRLGWSTSTASRYYRGQTLPKDDRVRQLCAFLDLEQADQEELLGLLEQARAASDARKWHGDPMSPARDEAPQPGGRSWTRGRGRLITLGCAALAGVLVAIVALTVLRHPAQPDNAGSPSAAIGSYPGLAIKAVPLKAGSLASGIAVALPHGADGYAFRNMKNSSLCLTAGVAGPQAGQNRDRVDIEPCDYAPNQIWIPEQWEAAGSRFSQLVNFRYQSKCLNANNIGGLFNGHKTMLWNCYQTPNEYWDFGDWYQNVKGRGKAYPIFVQSVSRCLDADKYDFGDGGAGAPVNIWNQYRTANQFWS